MNPFQTVSYAPIDAFRDLANLEHTWPWCVLRDLAALADFRGGVHRVEASARAAGGEARRCRHQCAVALPSHRLAGFDHLCAIRSCCLQLGTQVSTWPPMSPSQLIVLLKVLERLTLRSEPPSGAALHVRVLGVPYALRLSRCIGPRIHRDASGDAHQALVSAGGELWRPIGPTRSLSCSANRTSRQQRHSLTPLERSGPVPFLSAAATARGCDSDHRLRTSHRQDNSRFGRFVEDNGRYVDCPNP